MTRQRCDHSTYPMPRYLRPRPRRVLGAGSLAWSAVIALLALGAVEVITRLGVVSSFTLLPISTMVGRAARLLTEGRFLTMTFLPSIGLIASSFAISVVLGVALAYGLWRSDWWRRAVQPYLNVYYSVPTFALYPVFVVLFGQGALPILLISVAFSMVVVVNSALNGFGAVPNVVTKLSASARLSRRQHLSKVLLPAALPDIAIGVRLALVYSIISVLATQFILSTSGLGHYIAYAYNNFQIEDMYGGITIVCLIALVSNVLISRVLLRFDWREK